MSIFWIMLGALFIWLGIWYYKGAGGRAGSNPHYISVELSRKAGVFFVICGAIIIVCGFVVKPEGNTSGSSANTVTKTNTCQSCGRSFSDSTEKKYIRMTNMCKTCYKNYCYATGETPENYDR